jgi:integrase
LKAWKLRTKFNKPDDLVFPNKKGGYVGHDNMVKRKFNPLFDLLEELHAKNPKKYPKVKRFNWHALRHYSISIWIEAESAAEDGADICWSQQLTSHDGPIRSLVQI